MTARQRLRVRVGDREHDVEWDPRDPPGVVRVDGSILTVLPVADNLARVETADGSSPTTVFLARGDANEWWADVAGQTMTASVRTFEAATLAALQTATGTSTRGREGATAPMPGRIVKIFVEVGATVSTGQLLLVIEAMKMENEVHADGPGTVRSVRVAVGDTVDAGQVLVEIDLHKDS